MKNLLGFTKYGLIGTFAVLAPLCMGQTPKDGDKVLVRPQYPDGQKLRYNLNMTGAAAWYPTQKDLNWGKMTTDLTFVLSHKVVRKSGACTYELTGENLKTTGEDNKGRFEVTADRQRIAGNLHGTTFFAPELNPLTKEMTITVGPRWGFQFGTGLLPIAIYLLPSVDKLFWTLLTVAPEKEVASGDAWENEFEYQLPDSKGQPLKVKGAWKATGWEQYKGVKCLAMTLSAELSLKDTEVLLLNGDKVHVADGSYKADGKVLWDVEHGLMCSATAEQKILITCDRPDARALRSEVKCTLSLMEAFLGDKDPRLNKK
ncbi:MAG: hypothetical protein HZA50_10340 [Planctomycetes bacterium]|nr:hypothetical protein [Planctomycetota bacterium]